MKAKATKDITELISKQCFNKEQQEQYVLALQKAVQNLQTQKSPN
ncbi:hypothetical protein Q5H80_03040 [Vibrio sp. SNU_ST1]|nr:hypothetical protein [Vibrio sp. SNU_ST1]WKY58641.1 hypothetical protein Q5H80_03040 [Vibrio sp. SNU_ST1]